MKLSKSESGTEYRQNLKLEMMKDSEMAIQPLVRRLILQGKLKKTDLYCESTAALSANDYRHLFRLQIFYKIPF